MEKELEQYFDRLWPLCRSITGDGLRESLRILSEIVPLELHEVPSGTAVLDWEIPDEWWIKAGWIETPEGKKICNFSENNLHVVNYSEGVDKTVRFEELAQHLHHYADLPGAVPYITSYYKRRWGFCISKNEFDALPREGNYKVFIDAGHKKGSLTYGEAVLKGSSDREILFSTYVCHPSMANNELSGPLATAFLYKQIAAIKNRKYTYRFVFAPETIGVIAFLSRSGMHLREKLDAGYVLTCCGDKGSFTYKRSRKSPTRADRIAEHVLQYSTKAHEIINFAVGGSDERQYCSPGYSLPVGSLMRTPYKKYPEYHTSFDNKSVLSFSALAETVNLYYDIARALELDDRYQTTVPFGEPQLGKRGLYATEGDIVKLAGETRKLLHFISHADGETWLLDAAARFGCSITEFASVVQTCREHKLIRD
ncbi:MAG: hypothetical protein FD123_3602 [Bacteroidetes bacterium]|nr:MAG: hypothetical protein FD123_3602 [Bacteroidota bacterium]